MSYAPTDLQTVGQYLVDTTPLSWSSVGIVGDLIHDGGYHCGRDRCSGDDYSMDESSRDGPHATDAASAIDIGEWSGRAGAAQITFYEFNAALVDACRHGDPRAEAVREIIYTLDGVTVHRWDRLGIRSTGDSSHLYHTHISTFRDSEGRRADADNLFGLIQEILEGVATVPSEWHLGEPSGPGITQGPAHPANDAPWVPESIAGQQRDTVSAHAWHAGIKSWQVGVANAAKLDQLIAASAAEQARDAAEQTRDAALRAVVDALAAAISAGGGNLDTAAVLARIDAAVDRVTELQRRLIAGAQASAAAIAADD